MRPNPNHDSILWELNYDLDYDIYLFGHLQVMGDTSVAGNAHQFRNTWFHLPSFWLADSLRNVFLPLLAFRPLLAQYESSVLVCMVSHICWWCIFSFCLFIFQCGVFFMSVIVLVRDGNPLRTGAVGPFLVLCLVLVLLYVYTWLVVPAREGCAAFHVVYMLFVTNYVWKWIMTMEIDFVCLTSDSLTTFASY